MAPSILQRRTPVAAAHGTAPMRRFLRPSFNNLRHYCFPCFMPTESEAEDDEPDLRAVISQKR